MRDLLSCFFATAWVLGVIRYMGTRRHPRETPDYIDRDFREMVDRVHRRATVEPWHTPHDGPTDGCNCRTIPIEEGIDGKSTN